MPYFVVDSARIPDSDWIQVRECESPSRRKELEQGLGPLGLVRRYPVPDTGTRLVPGDSLEEFVLLCRPTGTGIRW